MALSLRQAFKNFKRAYRHHQRIRTEAIAIAHAARSHQGKKIFIDCGFNQCKVLSIFAKSLPDFTFYGFEPNPNFDPQARKTKQKFSNINDLSFSAVSNQNGSSTFWLQGEITGDHIQEGSSLISNKDNHQAKTPLPHTVQTINFSEWLSNLVAAHGGRDGLFIVVKMDIEGSEYDVLESMIKDQAIHHVDYLMIEFHSYCFKDEEKLSYAAREKAILNQLENSRVHVSQWF